MADDTREAQGLAERLGSAFASGDLALLAGILDPDVRWGDEEETPQTCHSRAEVLAWYGGLQAQGFRASVVGTAVEPDRVVLTLDVTRPDGGTDRRSQVFRIAGGRIVDIRGHREEPTPHP